MLNVVNFGGGAYVIYAEVTPTGEIHVDPEPYSDTFDRPARLLPIEAKALVAAIDLIGLAQADLRSARDKVVDALGFDPIEEGLHIVSPKVDDDIMHRAEIAIAEIGCSSSSTGRRARTATASARSSPTAASTRVRAGTSRPGTRNVAGSSTSGWTGSSAPKILDEHFEPSKDLDSPPTSAAGRAPAGSAARAPRG